MTNRTILDFSQFKLSLISPSPFQISDDSKTIPDVIPKAMSEKKVEESDATPVTAADPVVSEIKEEDQNGTLEEDKEEKEKSLHQLQPDSGKRNKERKRSGRLTRGSKTQEDAPEEKMETDVPEPELKPEGEGEVKVKTANAPVEKKRKTKEEEMEEGRASDEKIKPIEENGTPVTNGKEEKEVKKETVKEESKDASDAPPSEVESSTMIGVHNLRGAKNHHNVRF